MATKKTAGRATARPAKKAPSAAGPKARRSSDGGAIPARVFAQVSPKSVGGLPLFSATAVDAGNVVNFASEDNIIYETVGRLQQIGFEVLQVSRTTINIAGSAKLYEDTFGTKLEAQERETRKSGGVVETATFIESLDTDMAGLVRADSSPLADVVEGVAIEQPVYPMAPLHFPPTKAYWHLDVPGDVSLALNADRAHRSGANGAGISVVMCDSGWEPHPYFVDRGYRFNPTVLGPGATNAAVDENGHGTAESANIFAVAPDVLFQMVKMNFANSTASFNTAVALNPTIISCSWGSDIRNGPLSAANLALAAAIATAVANGIVVVFSAGNGHWGFPGQHPDVISAGGVFIGPNGAMQASDYASGFVSNIYPGRQSPDVCGLVGMRPRAAYIMLPLPQGCTIDRDLAGGTHPNADETTNNDGWAAISGTSAAAPQLAGVAALIKQACAKLTPPEVRDVMRKTAVDVTSGSSHPNTGGRTAVGVDTATGNGLVDTYKAVLSARLRCINIRPIRPIRPIQPIQPVQPVAPIGPVQPVAPIGPVQPIRPISPVQPVQPIRPVAPIGPIQPVRPIGPDPVIRSDEAGAADDPEAMGLSQEDVAYLEQIIIEHGELDL